MMVSMARAAMCVSLLVSVCQVRGSHIPAKMNRTIQNLLLHYKVPNRERFNGKPVFSREPLDSSMAIETKRLFMGGVLEAYEKLIGQMMKQLPTQTPPTTGEAAAPHGDLRAELSYILKKIQDLRKHRYQEQSSVLQSLQGLRHIQMDNLVVQSKALWELTWLYEEASLQSNQATMQRRRRRRRRQARRVKPPTSPRTN